MEDQLALHLNRTQAVSTSPKHSGKQWKATDKILSKHEGEWTLKLILESMAYNAMHECWFFLFALVSYLPWRVQAAHWDESLLEELISVSLSGCLCCMSDMTPHGVWYCVRLGGGRVRASERLVSSLSLWLLWTDRTGGSVCDVWLLSTELRSRRRSEQVGPRLKLRCHLLMSGSQCFLSPLSLFQCISLRHSYSLPVPPYLSHSHTLYSYMIHIHDTHRQYSYMILKPSSLNSFNANPNH